MQVSKEQYENYLVLVENFKKQCPSEMDQEEYESFLNAEYCKIVYSFYQKKEQNKTRTHIENYINAGLKKAVKYKYYCKPRNRRNIETVCIDSTRIEEEIDMLECKTEHIYYKKQRNESTIMNDPKLAELFVSEKVGWIDLKNDLFAGLNLRHICFVILHIQGINYGRIAHDFQCSVKTVERVIMAAKEVITRNAQQLGYRV